MRMFRLYANLKQWWKDLFDQDDLEQLIDSALCDIRRETA